MKWKYLGLKKKTVHDLLGSFVAFWTISFTVLLFVGITLGFMGCGKVKTQDEKVVQVSPNPDAQGSENSISQISEFYALYASDRGFTAAEIENLAKKFKGELEQVLGIGSLPVEEVTETLLQLYPASMDGVSAQVVAKGLTRKLTLFHWFDSKTELTPHELGAHAIAYFSEASETSVRMLVKILLKFDSPWAGGNGDGLISKRELAVAILVASHVSKFKFEGSEKGLPAEFINGVEGLPKHGLSRKQFELKLAQQISGRFPSDKISASDQKLETIALSLRIYQMYLLTTAMGVGGIFYPTQYAAALQAFSDINIVEEKLHLKKFVRLYDLPLMGGDKDENLNSVEMFFLATDLEYAERVLTVSIPNQTLDLSNSLKDVAWRVASGRIAQTVFELYDVDGNTKLSTEESDALFDKLGVIDYVKRRAFFEDVGLEEGSYEIVTGIKLIPRIFPKSELNRQEFEMRLVKMLPRLVR